LGAAVNRLSDDQITRRLSMIQGWLREGNYIRKGWIFSDFIDAMTFVNRVAFLAEKHTHHPEICIDYNRVVLKFTTHDVNGLSDLDFKLAEEINQMN
jgi:4a-hydroxytetrahydrobiopterin dehydratase